MYKEWNEVVPEVGDVNNQIDNDVQVVTKLTLGGVTTKWDQPLQVNPTVTDTVKIKVSPTDAGQSIRQRKMPNPFIPSWTGKKYGYAMTQIVKLDGSTVKESVAFMQQE